MYSHLIYTVSEYEQAPDSRGVSPIHPTDGEIIMQLSNIFAQLGLSPLLEVLEQWKNKSDDHILKALTEMNEALENGEELMPKNEKDRIKPVEFIQINDEHVRVRDIFRIKQAEEYMDDKLWYCIWINPVDDKVTKIESPLLDVLYKYASETERDEQIEALKVKLTDTKKVKFI